MVIYYTTLKMSFGANFCLAKKINGPPSLNPAVHDEGEPPGGILVGWVVSVAFGPPWWRACRVLC